MSTNITRRSLILGLSALPLRGGAEAREIGWEDLIPPGVPYSEIIGEGQMDEENDLWKPVFDANATKFNRALNGQYVKLPGYILPIDLDGRGVHSFILVPYMGACLHVPPPPPNQLVYVTTATPWRADSLWDAVWVHGRLDTAPTSTEVAEIGYRMAAEKIELYQWL